MRFGRRFSCFGAQVGFTLFFCGTNGPLFFASKVEKEPLLGDLVGLELDLGVRVPLYPKPPKHRGGVSKSEAVT